MLLFLLGLCLGQTAPDAVTETEAAPVVEEAPAVETPEGEAAEGPTEVLSPVRIPGTRVSLSPLPGFGLADTFAGITSPELRASVLVVEIPASYAETSVSLGPDSLDAKGVTVTSREETTINGYPATVVALGQEEDGTQYLKWATIFGNDTESVLLTATYPAELDADIGHVMKGELLAAAWMPTEITDPFEGMPFTVAEPLGYKVATRLANSLLLTKDGLLPEAGATDPVILVGFARSPAELPDMARFAQDRLAATDDLQNPEASAVEEVTVDGLPAVVIHAKGTDAGTQQAVAFYQAVIFSERRHFVIQGSAPVEKAEDVATLCGNVLQSFKKKAE